MGLIYDIFILFNKNLRLIWTNPITFFLLILIAYVFVHGLELDNLLQEFVIDLNLL